MKDEDKSREQLIAELVSLRRQKQIERELSSLDLFNKLLS
jgi:hypothetical protein